MKATLVYMSVDTLLDTFCTSHLLLGYTISATESVPIITQFILVFSVLFGLCER